MRIRDWLFLFGVISLIISGVGIVRSSRDFSILGFAISEKVAFMPSSSLFYVILLFVLSIIMIVVSITERRKVIN